MTSSGHLVIWSFGNLVLWSIWLSGHLVNMVIWSSGQYVIRSSGHPVFWSSGHLIIWSSSHWVIWSPSHQVIWSSGHLVIWLFTILWKTVLFLWTTWIICVHTESCFGDLIEQSGYLVIREFWPSCLFNIFRVKFWGEPTADSAKSF